MTIRQRIESGQVLVLDGAMGTYLDPALTSNNLWSAHALALYPNEITKIHSEYYQAGADIALTATYQASVAGYIEAGVCENAEEAKKLMKKSIELAKVAQTAPDQLVAGSVGPYGAYLAGGEEYTGIYRNTTMEHLRAYHKDRLDALQTADLLAIETIPNFFELRVLMEMVQQDCFVSLSIKNKNFMVDGTLLSEAIKEIETNPHVLAVGVNCFALDKVDDVLETLSKLTSLPLVVYPNSGESWDAQCKQWVDAPTDQTLVSHAETWVKLGCRIIGGCCRTTPGDIKQLASFLRS